MKHFFHSIVLLWCAIFTPPVVAFVPFAENRTPAVAVADSMPAASSTALSSSSTADFIVDPATRDAKYQGNMAQYLLDLHAAKATFNFCGGMLFQLDLTPALQQHLREQLRDKNDDNVVLHEADKRRMHQVDGYAKSSFADNRQYFHGREIRNVPHAAGGMGMVLQLSLAPFNTADGQKQYTTDTRVDPQGWSVPEMKTYDGWGSDRGRVWRQAADYDQEGFGGNEGNHFVETYGSRAFGLNHRFYLHKDAQGALWLSAEDGCEGTPAKAFNPVQSLMNKLF